MIRSAQGLAFGLLLSASVNWALGRFLAKLQRHLFRLLLRLSDHLVHDFLSCGFYMYAYETMSKCQLDFVIRR